MSAGGSGFWERSNAVDLVIANSISGWETVPYKWLESNLRLEIPPNIKYTRIRLPEPCIDISRDKAVHMAIQNGARWLFFQDTDLIMPPDTIKRLMAWDKPIVAGLYVRRHNPPFNEMLRFRKDGISGLNPVVAGEFEYGAFTEVDCVATGCLMIKTEVFDKVRPFQVTIDGQPCRPAFFLWTEWRLPVGGMSEDFSFVTRARQSGIPVYCDTSVQCAHMGPLELNPHPTGQMNITFPGS